MRSIKSERRARDKSRRNKGRRKNALAIIETGDAGGWKCVRLIDERTGNSCFGFDFPTNLGGFGFAVVDDDLAESPQRVRVQLKKRGAAFRGNKIDQVQLVQDLLKRVRPEPRILAMKPGWRDQGFVLGRHLIGKAKAQYRWRSNSRHPDLGDRHGSVKAWHRDVGRAALRSSYLTFCIFAQLSAVLPGYFRMHMKTSPGLKPLLPETAVYNLSGPSSSGKSASIKAAAGLSGPPDLITKWDFSRRGLEESAESRNDLLLPLDDTENHVEVGTSLKTALRWTNQIIPSGRSKSIAKMAAEAGLPDLTWSTFGLTSSPKFLDVIAEEIGWKRSKGEQARFIDIPVPSVSKAGIFDRLTGTRAERIEQGKRWIARVERGTAQNYGLILPEFIEFLLAADRTGLILELTERFVRRFAAQGDGWDQRFARKFGVTYAAGRLAVEAGILPWPKNWPMKAVSRCYRRALRAIRKDEEIVTKTTALFAAAIDDPQQFVAAKPSGTRRIRFCEHTLGVRTRYRGQDVCAVRDETLRHRAGSTEGAKAVVRHFTAKGLLKGGHGHARTSQLPLKIRVDGKNIEKPRFWLIDADGLRQLAAHHPSKPRSRGVNGTPRYAFPG
jgi:Domain of unknown function (DUF927)